MFQVGDRVRIRQWDDMEQEFGLTHMGSIDCRYHFTEEMCKWCEDLVTIKELYGNGGVMFEEQEDKGMSRFRFSIDMIEFYKERDLCYASSDSVTDLIFV